MTFELLRFQTHNVSLQNLRNTCIEGNIIQGVLLWGSGCVVHFRRKTYPPIAQYFRYIQSEYLNPCSFLN